MKVVFGSLLFGIIGAALWGVFGFIIGCFAAIIMLMFCKSGSVTQAQDPGQQRNLGPSFPVSNMHVEGGLDENSELAKDVTLPLFDNVDVCFDESRLPGVSLFDSDSGLESGCVSSDLNPPVINPLSTLPMVGDEGSVDVHGNPMGVDISESPFESNFLE